MQSQLFIDFKRKIIKIVKFIKINRKHYKIIKFKIKISIEKRLK